MRLFIAIDVDEAVKNSLKPLLSSLRKYRGVKAVEPENVHVTLQFLGEVPESKLDSIYNKLSKITSEFSPFPVKLGSIGFFPNKSRARVVWVGVESEKLRNLANSVRKEMKKLGFKEDKEFVAHATLARIKKINYIDMIRLIEEVETFKISGEWIIRDFRLKHSKLTPKGPIYRDIHVYELGAGEEIEK